MAPGENEFDTPGRTSLVYHSLQNWIIVFEYWRTISSIFWCCLQCNGYGHDTLLSLIRITNTFSITFSTVDNQQSSESSAGL